MFGTLNAVQANCETTDKQAPTVRDLLELTVLNQSTVAIAPSGSAVAYVAVTPQIIGDSNRIDLKLATVDTVGGVHVQRIFETYQPAKRSSGAASVAGDSLKTGILLVWSEDGETLFYSVPTEHGFEVHRKDVNSSDHVLFSSIAPITSLSPDGAQDRIKYCTSGTQNQIWGSSDPAFHYDPNTFNPLKANLWQADENKERSTICVDRNLTTGREVAAAFPTNEVNELGLATGTQPMTYQGWPVAGCYPSPNHQHLLCLAGRPRTETIGEPSESVAFVADTNDLSQEQEFFRFQTHRWGKAALLRWSPDSKMILELKHGPRSSEIAEYSLEERSQKTLFKSEWGINNIHLSGDSRYLFATREKPDVPPEFCRIDLQTGKVILLDPLNPQFANIAVPSYRAVEIPNQYGDVLEGYLFSPSIKPGDKSHPFVAIRGIEEDGFNQGGAGVEFPGLILASEGYYVLFFEMSSLPYHPSTKGNTAYTLLRWKSPLASMTKLIDDLALQGLVDRSRTAIAGLSAGADLVDYASAFSDLFQVGEATTGEVAAPQNYLLFENWRRKEFFAASMSLPFPDVNGIEKWVHVSATLNASHATMPILFQPPDSEALAGFWQPSALITNGVPADLYVYPDEGHVKVHPLNLYFVMTRNLQWFDFWLRGVEDPSAEFADQFRRWEKMRAEWKAKEAGRDSRLTSSVPTR